jgi:hypothetical protein
MGPIMEMPAGDKDEGTGKDGAEKGSIGSANSPAVHPEKPKVDGSAGSGSGESLTYRLMKELGLPTEPGIAAGDRATSDGKNEQRVTDASDEDGRLLN